MSIDDSERYKWNFRLLVIWTIGVVLAVVTALLLGIGKDSRLGSVLEDVLKWIGQVLGPICLLVLSRILGRNIVQTFKANLSTGQAYRLTYALSLAFIAFSVSTIIYTAFVVVDQGKADSDSKLRQLQALSNVGTLILVVILWPILSMLLDFLLGAQPGEPSPTNPAAANPPGAS